MKIASSVEYAARLMVRLARSYGQAAVPGEKLSESEGVPIDYVNQLLLRLRRAGLVISHRGAGGGYVLAQPPPQVNLGHIFRAVEGQVFEGVCGKYDKGVKDCHHQGSCSLSPVWSKLGALVEGYLENVTLAQLLEEPASACVKLSWLEKL